MLSIQNLSVIYNNKVHAIDDVTLDVEPGKIIGIIGPNGAGKSTMIKGILNIVPSLGQVDYNGEPIRKSMRKIAYVEQKSNIDMTFPMTVFDCVLLGTYPKLGLIKRPGHKERQMAKKALEEVGMTEFADRQIGELSGGQFQRVLIARTLAQDADLIFLDEPFVGIDIHSESIIMNLLHQMRDQGKTILVVHHDLSKVEDYFDGLILLKKTLLANGTVKEVFTQDNLTAAYGSSMFIGMKEEEDK